MNRSSRLFLSAVVLAILFGLPLLTLLPPWGTSLFYEQRNAAPIPTPSAQKLYSGALAQELEAAVSDHIAGRNTLIRTNLRLELLLSRPVVNELVVASDVLLPFHGHAKWDTAYLADQAGEMAAALRGLQDEIRAYGGYFCYVGLPLQSTYFHEHYPPYLDSRFWHTEAIRAAFTEAMAAAGVPFLDGHGVYEALGSPPEYYARTDHHYTYEGALVAYRAIMEQLAAATGLPLRILQEDEVELKVLENPYLGSSDRKLYGLWGKGADRLTIGSIRDAPAFTRSDLGAPSEALLYRLPGTDTEAVTYDLYMGGDFGETVISTQRPELPTILIFGDSFTNPLETLLWASFDEMYALDLRYYTQETLRAYVARRQPDIVLCVRDETTYLSPAGNGAVGE